MPSDWKRRRTSDKERRKELDSFDRDKEKEYKKYLNSKTRVVKSVVYGIVEYVLIFAALLFVTVYVNGDDLSNFQDVVVEMLKPGNFLFNALVAYLPLLLLGCIGSYFGTGTVGKLVFGVIKCLGLIVWLYFVVVSAGSIDLMDITNLNMGETGLEGLEIGTKGLAKLASFILLVSILIPIGEFAGARKRHNEAVAWHENTYGD